MSDKALRVILLPRAKKDIRKIWSAISADSLAAADKFIDKLDGRVKSLISFPDRGAPREEISKGLRVLIEGKYLIFYRVNSSKVEIVRVIHGAQDLTRHFS
jgi:toxin ParE1/3/4